MLIKELVSQLEKLAPLSLQEDYDNSGLLIGNENDEITKGLISLDLTEAVLQEAIDKQCDIIISHHPLIFSGLKRLNCKNYVERIIAKSIKHDIAVYAIHTNLDNVTNGVNKRICDVLGIKEHKILAPQKGLLRNLTTFVPNINLEDGRFAPDAVREALWKAGAGHIGEYDNCSFNVEGKGTFRALQGAKPLIGKEQELVFQDETRISVIFPNYLKNRIIQALKQSHPYQEVAYDLISLENQHTDIGAGMIGNFETEKEETWFLEFVKDKMKTSCIRHSPKLGRSVQKVAVCGGSGSFLLKNAIANGADAFITSDFKYHQFFDADGKILVLDIGHFESEQFTIDLLYDEIQKNFPNFALLKTTINTNPVNYL